MSGATVADSISHKLLPGHDLKFKTPTEARPGTSPLDAVSPDPAFGAAGQEGLALLTLILVAGLAFWWRRR